jgi:hypothetical protein
LVHGEGGVGVGGAVEPAVDEIHLISDRAAAVALKNSSSGCVSEGTGKAWHEGAAWLCGFACAVEKLTNVLQRFGQY